MYIYKTTNKINGKFYVGKSKYNPDENPEYYGSGLILKRAIEKYGKENFKKEIIEECSTTKKTNAREKYWVKELKSNHRGVGYNISSGGDWGDVWSHHPRREEYRKFCRKRSMGKKNNNYGNYWTPEQKHHMSVIRKKNKTFIDKKTGQNVAKSPEARAKNAKAKMGIKNPMACKWKLISPDGKEHIIYGGIKRKIKRFGIDYQQFHVKDENNECIRRNLSGWILVKIPKNNA